MIIMPLFVACGNPYFVHESWPFDASLMLMETCPSRSWMEPGRHGKGCKTWSSLSILRYDLLWFWCLLQTKLAISLYRLEWALKKMSWLIINAMFCIVVVSLLCSRKCYEHGCLMSWDLWLVCYVVSHMGEPMYANVWTDFALFMDWV